MSSSQPHSSEFLETSCLLLLHTDWEKTLLFCSFVLLPLHSAACNLIWEQPSRWVCRECGFNGKSRSVRAGLWARLHICYLAVIRFCVFVLWEVSDLPRWRERCRPVSKTCSHSSEGFCVFCLYVRVNFFFLLLFFCHRVLSTPCKCLGQFSELICSQVAFCEILELIVQVHFFKQSSFKPHMQ